MYSECDYQRIADKVVGQRHHKGKYLATVKKTKPSFVIWMNGRRPGELYLNHHFAAKGAITSSLGTAW